MVLLRTCDCTDRFIIIQTVELNPNLAALESDKVVCLLKCTIVTLRRHLSLNGPTELRSSYTVPIMCWHITFTTALWQLVWFEQRPKRRKWMKFGTGTFESRERLTNLWMKSSRRWCFIPKQWSLNTPLNGSLGAKSDGKGMARTVVLGSPGLKTMKRILRSQRLMGMGITASPMKNSPTTGYQNYAAQSKGEQQN